MTEQLLNSYTIHAPRPGSEGTPFGRQVHLITDY